SPAFRTRGPPGQMPAKKGSGRLSSNANHTGGGEPSGKTSFAAKLVKGTMQRLSTPSHRRQWDDLTLRMLVTPGSVFLPAMAKVGDGMPQRAMASSRTPSAAVRTIGAELIGKDA